MRIKKFETNPHLFPETEFATEKPICFVCGSQSDIALDLLREMDDGICNVYTRNFMQVRNELLLSESDRNIYTFKKFLEGIKSDTNKDDHRPVFIYDFLNCIDEAVDITPFIDELATLGRQVFVAVGARYPEKKMSHPNVQVIKINECPL